MDIFSVHQEFIFDCEMRKLSGKTIRAYKNNLLIFFNFVEECYKVKEIELITSKMIKEFLRHLSSNGRKSSYINAHLKILKVFFAYCSNEEYILSNPALKIPYAKEATTIIKTFTDEEVKRMILAFKERDYLSIRNRTLIVMLADTCMRANELCEFCSKDIYDGFIRVMGKGNKERVIGLSPFTMRQLTKYSAAKQGYFEYKVIPKNMFLSRTGQPLTVCTLENVVREAGKRVKVNKNIRCSPHTLRHYFAQAQLRNNLDIYSLSRIMGHSSIKITQKYLQSIEDSDIVERSVVTSPLMNLF